LVGEDERTFRRRWEEEVVGAAVRRHERVPDLWEERLPAAEVRKRREGHLAHLRAQADRAWEHHVERERRRAEYGCTFGDELRLWSADRAVVPPAVVLGTPEPRRMRPALGLQPSSWANETAGRICRRRLVWGVCLPVRSDRRSLLNELQRSRRFIDAQAPADLSRLVDYHGLLARHGLTAERAYVDLEEAWYPVDLACLDGLVDVDAVVGAEQVLAALAGDAPTPAWQTIARAVWPGFDDAQTAGRASRAATDDWARDLVLAITTQNSGHRGLAPQLGASRAPGRR
jgi:hypothetical protein